MNENPLRSLTAANVVVVAGKGGVGKTTVTAVVARAAARSGRRVLVIELDGKPMLEELLPERDGEDLTVVHLSAPDALEEYLNDHGFRRIAKRLNRTGVIDMVGTAAPGIDDIVVLGKVKQYERVGDVRPRGRRRPGRWSRRDVPHVGGGVGRCGARRSDPVAGRRGVGTAGRSRALHGAARDHAGDDPGQRDDRNGVRTRGRRRHPSRADRRQRGRPGNGAPRRRRRR